MYFLYIWIILFLSKQEMCPPCHPGQISDEICSPVKYDPQLNMIGFSNNENIGKIMVKLEVVILFQNHPQGIMKW